MIACPRCGFYNMEDRRRCLRCEAALDDAPELRPVRRRLPSFRLFAKVRGAWHRLHPWLFPEPDRSLTYRQPWVAASASLVPGGGQIYNRQFAIAAIHFLVFAGLVGAGIAFILQGISDWLFLAALLWLNYSINQAFHAAQTINGSVFTRVTVIRGTFIFIFLTAFFLMLAQWVAMVWFAMGILVALLAMTFAADEGRYGRAGGLPRPGVYFIPICFLLAVLLMMWLLPGFFFRSVFSLRWIGQSVYAPLVHKGDRVLFESIVFGLRGPRLGDIVLYDPPRFKLEDSQGNVFLINMPLGMERIVGLPGDFIERRNGEWFRNGEPMPPYEQPLVQHELWANLELQVPENEYAVLASYSPAEFGILGTIKPPQINSAIAIGWHEASTVPATEMWGRAVMVYRPATHRKWLTRDSMKEKSDSGGR